MKISNEELKEIGQVLIAASEGKPLQYHMGSSDNPWKDYKETDIDLEYELHLYRQGKRFRVKDTTLMDTKEQLLKECKDLGIISIEADNLTEGLIRDAIAAVKESEPYVKKAIEEAKRELGDKDVRTHTTT